MNELLANLLALEAYLGDLRDAAEIIQYLCRL